MKKFFIAIICAMAFAMPSFAQGLNDKGDNIIGEYLTDRGGSKSKVRITKNSDGSYNAQVFWVENPYEADGKTKRKDVKNPDKALRNVPVDQIILVKGLKYDAAEKCWGGAKIYDLDGDPAETKHWSELENIRAYYDLFESRRREFE